ncbi:MAG: hypothetical protein HOO95_07420 [Gallionella sp.]|nr:hypothetical protein [Gallionella sp.]
MKLTHLLSDKLQAQFLGILLTLVIFSHAHAQPLDDVRLEYQATGIVATIRLTAPIQYLRHFPASHGKTVEIFYERLPSTAIDESWLDNELRKSPPSTLIPSFTVATRDQQTKPKLIIEFDRETDYNITSGKDERSLLITFQPKLLTMSSGALPALPTIKPEELSAPAANLTEEESSIAENNKKARTHMVEGRDALQANNNEIAVNAFNKLLLLPPNSYTQDGQEWVGVARERALQIDKAKTEYDLYLRLYPAGEGAARVVQRLVALAGLEDTNKSSYAVTEKKQQPPRRLFFGNLSSRYYYGHSKIETTAPFNNASTTSSQSLVDQRMLISSVDASQRYVSEEYDNRLVFRDVNTQNFLNNQPSQNRVNAAYGEIKNLSKDYFIRLGRQSSSGDGVLGRFDGISAAYGNTNKINMNAVAGTLSDFSQGSKPMFFGASINKGPTSVYAINQRVDGMTDRQAMGAEIKYYQGGRTAFALLDYDTYFKELNAVQVLGSVNAYGGTMNFMVDHRKAPTLSIRNALNGAGTSSINALLQTMPAESLRKLALARTATSNMGQIGLSIPLREKWQVSGDVRLTNTSGLPASGLTALEGKLQATPSRGTEMGVTGQVIGTGLYRDHDIWSGSITFNTSSAVNGYSIYLYNYNMYNNGWTINTSLQLYRQKDQFGSMTTRTSPMIRGAYRIKEQLYFDLDGGLEFSDFTGTQQTTKTTRIFYSGGLSWSF